MDLIMRELSKQEAYLIKNKIEAIFFTGDLHELNEINSILGLELINGNLNIDNPEDSEKIEQAVRNILTSFGDGIKNFDKKEILEISTNFDRFYLKDFLQNMSDDIKLSVVTEFEFGLFGDIHIIDIINSMQSDEKKLEALALQKNDDLIPHVAEKVKNDEILLKMMDLTDSDRVRADVAYFIQSDELKLKALERLKDECDRAIVIKGIKNDKLKKELLETIQSEYGKSMIIQTMSDEEKLEQLQTLTNENERSKIIETMQDDSYKVKALEFVSNDYNKAQIIKTVQSIELKVKLIDTIKGESAKVEIIGTIQNSELKSKLIDTVEGDYSKAFIVRTMQDDTQKLDLLKGLGEYTRESVIVTLDSDESKLEALKMYTDENFRLHAARKLTFQDDKIKLEVMNLIKDQLLTTKLRKTMQLETISENLELIMQYEGITDEIDEKVKLLKQMEKRNDSLYNTIDFQMLDKDIVSSFSQEQLEQLVCYPDIEGKIIALRNSPESWNMFQKMFATISHDTQNWDIKTNRILEQLNSNTYQGLINNIGEQDVDINKLVKIMQMPNYFNIQTQEDLENFSNIKRNICDRIISGEFKTTDRNKFELISNMNEIDQVRFAVLQKLYGQDLETAKTIIEKYGNDIDSLDQNSDEVIFVRALQEIIQTDNIELLKRYYSVDRGIEEVLIDSVTMENQLKHDYGRMFNRGLLQAEGLEPGEIEGTLKAGTDFRLIITSVAPFIRNTPENFEQDWNRKAIASQGFCCSYLTSDMIGTAPIPHLCYGFSEMSDDALMLSGPTDIYSNAIGLEATARHDERYYSPENQINNTIDRGARTYNEMVFKRQQNGEKKQPSYIVVFKEKGIIPNMEVAQKAMQQWQEAGIYLPIVIVDKDECAKANKEQIEEALTQCKTQEELKTIRQRLENNRKWNRLDFEELVPIMEETEKDFASKVQNADERQDAEQGKIEKAQGFLENCYQSTDAQDREKATSAIKIIYREMQEIKQNHQVTSQQR